MANSYFNKAFDVVPGNLIRSQAIEDEFLRVEQGFDGAQAALVPKASPATTGTGSHTGNFTITGNETVTGGLSVGGSETVTGGMSVGTSLSVGTNLTVGGSETVTGGMSVGGAITAGGKVTAGAGPSALLDLTTKDYVDSLVTATAFSTSLPLQSGNAGKFVTTNGTSASWAFAGIAQVTTATTATTLTNTPTLLQITPTGYGVTVTLPNATTCPVGGPLHCIDNQGPYTVVIRDNSGAIKGFLRGNSVSYISLDNNSTAAGNWAINNVDPVGVSAALYSTAIANGSVSAAMVPGSVRLDSNRELIQLYTTGSYAAVVVYDRSTNTFGAITTVRAISTGGMNMISCGTDKVLVVTLDAATGLAMEAVVVSVTGTSVAVGTAATATLSAIGTLNGMFIPCNGSYIISYSVSAVAAQIRALTVSGTTVTIGSASGTTGTTVSVLQAAGTVLLAASAFNNVGTIQPYTVSGTTLTAGTAATYTGGTTVTVQHFAPLGSRWYVGFTDSTNGPRVGVVSLSGTTATLSSANAFATASSFDAAVIGTNKVLIVGRTSGAVVTLMTDTGGTASVGGTPIALNNSVAKNVLLVDGTDAYVREGDSASTSLISKVDCSGSSPVLAWSRTMTTATSSSAGGLVSTGNRNTDLSMTGLTLVGTKATYSAPQTDGGSSRLAYRLTNGVPDLINPASTPTSVSTRGASDSERLGFLASTLLVKVECVA